jgi:hypothetical protein
VRNAVTNIPSFKSDKLEIEFWSEGCNGAGSAHFEGVLRAMAGGLALLPLPLDPDLDLDLDLDPVLILILN